MNFKQLPPFIIVTLILSRSSSALSSPFTAQPVDFCSFQTNNNNCQTRIPLYVDQLSTDYSLLPFDYNHFDFCSLDNEVNQGRPDLNWGRMIFGNHFHNSPYEISFLRDQKCSKLCSKTFSKEDPNDSERLKILMLGMKLNYQHHWIIDDMPITFCFQTIKGTQFCSIGFPMGCFVSPNGVQHDFCVVDTRYSSPDTYYIANHIDLVISYEELTYSLSSHVGSNDSGNQDTSVRGRIVRINANPRSIHHVSESTMDCSAGASVMAIPANASSLQQIIYSYSVRFEKIDIKWESRLDYLLQSGQYHNTQWFSILNTLVIITFLGVGFGVKVRRLRRDVTAFNQCDDKNDSIDFGWQLVHGDVFRPPCRPMLLSVLVGCGAQLICVAVVLLFLASVGLFSTMANRAYLVPIVLVLYSISGCISAYVSARIYKTIGGAWCKTNVILTCFLCPGIFLSIFLLINLLLWSEASSAAISVSGFTFVLLLYLVISIPSTCIGSFLGFRKKRISIPVSVERTPRDIPHQPIYCRPWLGVVMGGILPFSCIFIQLFFMLNGIWGHQPYHMFGFMSIVFVLLVIICGAVAILLCYIHLCAKNYHWWWRSFFTSGSTAFYVLFYCVYYFVDKLMISGFVSIVLYFLYTFMMVFGLFLLTGTIGFLSCFWFTRKLYSSIKVDHVEEFDTKTVL